MKSKKAKFFCENCGSEVPENAKVCKVCGKFFISVRCPQCGAIGNHDDFAEGCPKCGYADPKTSKGSKNNSSNPASSNTSASIKFFSGFKRRDNYSERKEDSSLPVWIYIFTAIVFISMVFALYSCIK